MAVRNSPEADEDIARIYAYGLDDYGSAAAETYLFDLLDEIERLAENPYIVPVRMTEGGREFRLLPVGAHHVLYTIDDENVVVVRVLHGRADWRTEL